jgi:uncharacterized protein (DUF488 family)
MDHKRTMTAPVLFTIGHSNHDLGAFLDLLRRHGITLLADVRSSPYSRFNPQFNRETLTAALENRDVEYSFLGRELGARREEPQCYVGPRVQYDRVAVLPIFRQGLSFLRTAIAKGRVALVCAEKDPLTCHRAFLVCRHLRNDNISIRHILEDGTIETNAAAEERLLALLDMPSATLFQSKDDLIEEAYDRQGERIAYVESPEQAEEAECSF